MVIEEVKLEKKKVFGPSGRTVAECLYLPLSRLPSPFLLESDCEGDEQTYSFAGADPFLFLEAKGEEVRIRREGTAEQSFLGDPIEVLGRLLDEFRTEPVPGVPFVGGAVGYFGYECAGYMEKVPVPKEGGGAIPDLRLSFYDTVIVFDHKETRAFVVSTGFPEKGEGRAWRAKERVHYFKEIMDGLPEEEEETFELGDLASNMTHEEFIASVGRIKAYIEAGDVYQVNLSHRLSADFKGSPFGLYKRFREANPVPFGACLSYPDLAVVSNSPERFLSLKEGILESRPIKGTIRRDLKTVHDEALQKELLKSEKDGAEHVMIVDLVRNDLGRVCRYGSVSVKELKGLESYSNLHHLVSIVSGEINEGVTAIDCIRAAFPGGSITGAPKVRAMEIIHEVEPVPRSLYTGSIGYLGFDGSMDLNIAIRTAFISGGKVYFSVGGGIVADSDPEAEYDETLLKGEIFRRIISGGESL